MRALLVLVLLPAGAFLVSSCDTSEPAPCGNAIDCFEPCQETCGPLNVTRALCIDEVCECECGGSGGGGTGGGGGGVCSEDASDSISVTVTPTMSFDTPSVCPSIADPLLRQDATITVTNTSNSRGIRLGAVLYRSSDQQTLARGCQGDNLNPGETVEECIERSTAGCNGPLVGPAIGSGGILLPGETTTAVPFVCEQQFIFQPPGSNGTCGESVLENVTENWIVQGVYCEPGEDSSEFCAEMAETQARFGEASPMLGSVETTGCP